MNELCTQPVLKMPDMFKDFILQTDAHENALGAVLLQEYDGEHFRVAYASKKTPDAGNKVFSDRERMLSD